MIGEKVDALTDRVNMLFEKFQQLMDHVNMVLSHGGFPLKKSLPQTPSTKKL